MSSGPHAISHTLQNTLGKVNGNLSSMLKSQNLLEEDGLEDLHFYFVEFNQHKRLIMQRQK